MAFEEKALEKRIVLPGEKIFDAPKCVEGTYIAEGATYAAVVSLVRGEYVIPLKGFYIPRPGDTIVGVITEETFGGYCVDIYSPYNGIISKEPRGRRPRGMRGYARGRERVGFERGFERGFEEERFTTGDVVAAHVENVDEVHNAVLSRPMHLKGGEIIEIESVKVPRVIGKNATMLNIIKEHTKCNIVVGNNGRVYLRGGNTALAILAILKICEEAHVSGLTDRVKHFIETEAKRMQAEQVQPVQPGKQAGEVFI